MSGNQAARAASRGGASESYLWPIVAMFIAILPQVLVPARDRVGPIILVPLIEAGALLLMVVIAAKPGPVPARARPVILALFGVLVLANAFGAARLVAIVLSGHRVDGTTLTAGRLLVAGALVMTTNIITFALLYWELDSGGPVGRAGATAKYPDFQFPQTSQEGLAPPDWVPRFHDYLYVAFTNLVSFSPTDTMPLTGRAKGLMTLQSLISLGVLVVVISRVINILPSPDA